MSKKIIFLLILIFILSLGIRTYHLDKIPAGFFCDEAANGFNAYTLSQRGVDEHGVSYPFFFRSFGDYRNPVAIYSMIPFIKLLGLNEFSVRMTNALYGSLTIIVIFFLARKLFGQKAALFSALLLAISPWHIHFSRTGFEFILFPFYFSLALLFFLEGLEKPWSLILSALFWGIAFYTYYPSQMVIPVFLLFLVVIYREKLLSQRKKIIILCLIITLVWALPFLLGIKQGTILTRFKNVSIFETLPWSQAAKSVFLSFINHFSPLFLFFKGDIDFPGHFIARHSVRGMGELYLFQLPLIVIGAYWLAKKASRKIVPLVLLLFLIYPLGSIFTVNGPFAHRSIIGVIPFHLLSGVGINQLVHIKKRPLWLKTFIAVLVSLALLASFIHYSSLYFKKYPLYSSDFWGWQYGPKEIMKYFLTAKDSYDDLYMSGEFNAGKVFLKFYDPDNACSSKCKLGDFWRTPEIYNPKRRQLFALSPEYLKKSNFHDRFNIKQTVYYPNNVPAFFIGEISYR